MLTDIVMDNLVIIAPFIGVFITLLSIGEYFDGTRVARRIKKKRTGKEFLRKI